MSWTDIGLLILAVWIGLIQIFLVLVVTASRAPTRAVPPPADNLGTRVRSLIESGAFDAQIERAIQRNAKRRG